MKVVVLLLVTLYSCVAFADFNSSKCNKCGIDNKFVEHLSSSYMPNLELPSIDDIKKTASIKPTIIVFISSKVPVQSLRNYTLEAKKYNNIVFLLRGLVNSSFISTKDFVSSFEGGAQIQEDAFDNYNISVVPTIVLAKEDSGGNLTFDKVSGNISIRAALEIFAENGDMKSDAKEILGGRAL